MHKCCHVGMRNGENRNNSDHDVISLQILHSIRWFFMFLFCNYSGKRQTTTEERRKSGRICTNCANKGWENFIQTKWTIQITHLTQRLQLRVPMVMPSQITALRAWRARKLETRRVLPGAFSRFICCNNFKLLI